MAKILKDAALIIGVVAIGVATYGAALGPTAAAAAGSAGLGGSLSVAGLSTALSVAAAGVGVIAALAQAKPRLLSTPMRWGLIEGEAT